MEKIIKKIIEEELKDSVRKYQNLIKKWEKSIFKNLIFCCVPASRGKKAEKILVKYLQALNYTVQLMKSVKTGFDMIYNEKINVEIKYASENLVYNSKGILTTNVKFTFDQIRPYNTKDRQPYHFILFFFLSPDWKKCRFFSIERKYFEQIADNMKKEGYNNKNSFTMSVMHHKTDSYLISENSEKNMKTFYKFGDGTLKCAMKKMLKKFGDL